MYTTIAQRRRSRAFDTIVGATEEALSDPVLVTRLGGAATGLAAATKALFLPNVSHGVASIPAGHETGNGAALLPVKDVASRKPIGVIDKSLISQTPQRIARNGLTIDPNHPAVSIPSAVNKDAIARTIVQLDRREPRYISRSLIAVDRAMIAKVKLRPYLPSLLLHELYHDYQFQEMAEYEASEMIESVVAFELPAYCVGAIAIERSMELGTMTAAALKLSQPTLELEQARRDTTPWDDRFGANETLVSLYAQNGYDS